MSTTIAEGLGEAAPPPSRTWVASWIGLLAGLSAVIGALSGVLWSGVVDLPEYLILADGSATITERGLTEVAAADIWYVTIGAGVGLGLGLVAWKWFRQLGWPSALLAVGAGLLAGAVCWQFGELLGPNHFADRLATAKSGDLVPIDLQLRSWSALAAWGLAAVIPVLLAASFGPDEEEGTIFRRRRAVVEPEADPGTVDERGVLTDAEDAIP